MNDDIERLTAENKDFQTLYEAQAVVIHILTGERNAALVDAKRWQTMYEREHSKVGIVAINSIPKKTKHEH